MPFFFFGSQQSIGACSVSQIGDYANKKQSIAQAAVA